MSVTNLRVIVAGGGLVGLTTGLALRSLGARVTIHEQAPAIRAAGASIGLWKNALDVFTELGIGEKITAIGTPVATWFYDASGQRFRAAGFSDADYAFLLVPRPALNTVLAEAAGVDIIRLGSRVVGFEEQAEQVLVHFASGESEAADLLVGADGVYSPVRSQLLPGYAAQAHAGHHVWRAMLPAGNEPAGGTILTVGHHQTRGGYSRAYGNQVVWMVNQFNSPEPTGTKKEEALRRAAYLTDQAEHDPLRQLIEATPEEHILHNQVMRVPALPRWTSSRVALIGDAAHALSPHISAGGTLGIEDVEVLVRLLSQDYALSAALHAYEANRLPHYQTVQRLAQAVEQAPNAQEYARHYATFSHWMLHEGYQYSRR